MSVHTQAQNSVSAETLSWLYGLEPAAIKLGLERTEALLAAVGDPHHTFPSVHITGTTGKGSTAAMTESILRTAGYTTGMYTSPHIFDLTERFRLDGQPMSQDDMTPLIAELRVAMEDHSIDATFHEFTTV
ncbi:bifunctional folylpolyglutamate synthase/dihydrofolate synthase, partial [bacterium]|nr:bifunctional folylpolyglutamate synthase/dihydrofolate synthase [bacterium]